MEQDSESVRSLGLGLLTLKLSSLVQDTGYLFLLRPAVNSSLENVSLGK